MLGIISATDPATVSRLANIPHGTSLVAQGVATTLNGAPTIPPADITPFVITQPGNLIHFPETNLGVPSNFRTPPGDIPHVTQATNKAVQFYRVRSP